MVTLAHIESSLADFHPTLVPDAAEQRRAAVALIIDTSTPTPHILFIRRAQNPADPWSGHLAFPGGRFEPEDNDIEHTAVRETEEEVGVDLSYTAGVRRLGRLDDVQGRARGASINLVISCFVYTLSDRPTIRIDATEVDQIFWVSLDDLLSPIRQVAHRSPQHASDPYPGIQITGETQPVLWGLTYRFTREMLRIAGAQLPAEVA